MKLHILKSRSTKSDFRFNFNSLKQSMDDMTSRAEKETVYETQKRRIAAGRVDCLRITWDQRTMYLLVMEYKNFREVANVARRYYGDDNVFYELSVDINRYPSRTEEDIILSMDIWTILVSMWQEDAIERGYDNTKRIYGSR